MKPWFVVSGAVLTGVAGALGFFFGPAAAALALIPLVGVVAYGWANIPSAPIQRIETPVEVRDQPAFVLRNIWGLVVAALMVRWLAAIGLNATSLWRQFAPDAVFYELAGRAIVRSWHEPGVDLTEWFGSGHQIVFFPYVNALFVELIGSPRYPVSLLNGVIAVLAIINIAFLTRDLYGPVVARRVFILSAFFPSLVLWSSMNIREAWSFLLLSLILRGTYRLKQRVNPVDAVVLLGALFWLGFIRAYLVPLLGLGVLLSLFVVRVRQLAYAIIGLAVLLFTFRSLLTTAGYDLEMLSAEGLQRVDAMRRHLAFGGSAYGGDVDTSTLVGALAYLPEGVARFLLSPFPWQVNSWRQLVALPETLVWYVLAVQGVRGGWYAIRTNASRAAPIFFIVVVMTLGYGLASGNEGTAYRHRAQVLLLVFVFSALHQVTRRALAAPVLRKSELTAGVVHGA